MKFTGVINYPLLELGLSQIYLNEDKVKAIEKWFNPDDMSIFEPLPVHDYGNGKYTLTDGHSRAYIAYKYGLIQIPIIYDDDDMVAGEMGQKLYNADIEWYSFAKQFKGVNDRQTIENVLSYTADIAKNCHDEFSEMKFGGTEKEILDRGTDWCADLARVGVVLLACNDIPARIVHLVNLEKAYNGHVVVEAFYEGKYGLCDFLYGYNFYENGPLDAYALMHGRQYLKKYSENYAGLYSAIAINEYDPMDKNNDYTISVPNQYTLNLIYTDHNDKWIMGEDL